jgi:hypothetical protein
VLADALAILASDSEAEAMRAAPNVPELMLLALVVSVVAEAANATPPVLVQVIASVPVVVQSPERSPLVTEVEPENFARLPEAGEPVVVTVPERRRRSRR